MLQTEGEADAVNDGKALCCYQLFLYKTSALT